MGMCGRSLGSVGFVSNPCVSHAGGRQAPFSAFLMGCSHTSSPGCPSGYWDPHWWNVYRGKRDCSLLKYPLSTEFDVPFAGMSPPCPLKVAQHSWPGVQQVLGGPGSVWGWSPALRPHKPSPSPATEWKIPAFQAYVIWEEVNGSAIYIHLFGDFAAAFALQSPCGVEKELN